MTKELQKMLFKNRNITDINLFGNLISWSQAVCRVVIVCPSDLLTQTELITKTTLDNWANENGFKLIDIEYASKLIADKEAYINGDRCTSCPFYPHYLKLSDEEIKKITFFPEVGDEPLRNFLADYLLDIEESIKPFSDDFINVFENYYEKYVYFFSSKLTHASVLKDTYNENQFLKRELLDIPASFSIRSRKQAVPSFIVCDENTYNNDGRWFGTRIHLLPKPTTIWVNQENLSSSRVV